MTSGFRRVRSIAALVCACAALIVASPGAAQTTLAALLLEPGGQSTVHPADLALREWKQLDLTREQVSAIRGIQNRVLDAAEPVIEALHGLEPPRPEIWWGEAEPDEEKMRRSFRELTELEIDFFVRFVELGREVYELLDPHQRETLRALQRTPPDPRLTFPEEARLCIGGYASGGFVLNSQVTVHYAVSFEGDTAEVGVVWVGRAEEELYGTAAPPDPPDIPDAPRFLTGGNMENWYVQYDRETNRAWLDTERIDLGSDNVILLHGVEWLHDPPEVMGTHRIPSRLYTGGCRGDRDWSDILTAALLENESIRAFVGMD